MWVLIKRMLLALSVGLISVTPAVLTGPVKSLREGDRLYQRQEYSRSLDCYREAEKVGDLGTMPAVRIAKVQLVRRGRASTEEAQESLRKAGADEEVKLVVLGILAFERKDYAESQRYLESALKARPFDEEARYYLARSRLLLGEYDAAMGEFNSILARTDLAPSRWKEDSHYNLGLLHMVRHDQDAVEHLRKAEEAKFDLDLNKKAAKLLAAIGGWKGEHGQELVDFVSTGTALLSVGEVRLARGQFERAIEMEGDVERDNATPLPPDGLEALAYLGYIDWLEGKELSAEERLDRFAHLRADSPLGYYFLGVLRRSQGRLKEAAAEFQRAIGIDPKSAPAYVEMGRTLVLQRDYNGAAAAFECAVEIDPDNVGYLLQAARFYLDHALRPDRALEIAERATHLAPDSAETLDMLGWGLWANGRTYDARYSLERAVETDPELASAHYHLAVLLEKTGDEQASAQEFQRAVEVDSSGNYAAEAEEALRTLGAHH